MSNVLITGASGFIGRSLIRNLIGRGYNVFGIARSNSAAGLIGKSKIYSVDLSDYASVKKTISKINPEIIFHLAAYPDKGNRPEDIRASFDCNVAGTFNLLMAASEISYKKFVFAGSYKEYGSQPVPFKEDYPLMPLSCYAASKAAAEQYCSMFRAYGKPVTTLRLATIYGPGQEGQMLIPCTIKSALKNEDIKITAGTQARDFLYIDDAVDALIKAAESGNASDAFNIGSGYDIQVKKITEKIIKLCKSRSKVRIGSVPQRQNEVMRMYGDISKAKNALKWKPKTNLDEGLKKTIEWHKRN